ncbi:MAG: PEP-CTERM sorting domain-containing protein [Planctomycetota bacterium]
MICTRILARCFVTALLAASFQSNAFSALMISFSADDASIRVGETIDIDVLLMQTGSATPVGISSIGLTGAEIHLELDTLSAGVTDLQFGDGFADLFMFSDLTDPFSPILSVLSLDSEGVTAVGGLPTAIEIGSFTFTGNSVGTTIVTNLDVAGLTQFSFDGISTDFDDQILNNQSIAIHVSAVPEPGSLIMLLSIGSCVAFRRGRRPCGT